jgi:hypothetical protein
MDLTKDEAHMFMMDIEQCKKVIEAVRTNGPGTDFWEKWQDQRMTSLSASIGERVKARRSV